MVCRCSAFCLAFVNNLFCFPPTLHKPNRLDKLTKHISQVSINQVHNVHNTIIIKIDNTDTTAHFCRKIRHCVSSRQKKFTGCMVKILAFQWICFVTQSPLYVEWQSVSRVVNRKLSYNPVSFVRRVAICKSSFKP